MQIKNYWSCKLCKFFKQSWILWSKPELLCACVLVCRAQTCRTHGHAKFVSLINLIINNESIMYYFYRLIKYYSLIPVKRDLFSLKKCKQNNFFSFIKMIIFLNLVLAEKHICFRFFSMEMVSSFIAIFSWLWDTDYNCFYCNFLFLWNFKNFKKISIPWCTHGHAKNFYWKIKSGTTCTDTQIKRVA